MLIPMVQMYSDYNNAWRKPRRGCQATLEEEYQFMCRSTRDQIKEIGYDPKLGWYFIYSTLIAGETCLFRIFGREMAW